MYLHNAWNEETFSVLKIKFRLFLRDLFHSKAAMTDFFGGKVELSSAFCKEFKAEQTLVQGENVDHAILSKH